MQNFEYCVPTKVVFGRDTESRCGELVRECGGTHALVVYGGGSAVRSGLLDRCTDSLKAAGIPYELLGGVQPNPRLSRVRDGIALAKETGADFLLAIGGGSVIDTAKAIGYALANPEFDIWDLFMGKATAKACAPVGAVLTISGSFAIGAQCSALTGFPSTDYSTHTLVLHIQDYSATRLEMGYASAVAVVLFVIMVVSWTLVDRGIRVFSDE